MTTENTSDFPPLPKPDSVSVTNWNPGSVELRDNYTKQQMRDYVAADRLARQEPAGYKLVPLEPTEEMHVAAVRTLLHCAGNADFPPRVYRAMLAAAPKPSGLARQEPVLPASSPEALVR